MKHTVVFVFIIQSLSVKGQPILTAANSTPIIGEQINYYVPSFLAPTPGITYGGANQTWDVSAYVTTQMGTINYIDPATTPYASNFPSSNICIDNFLEYEYFEADSLGFKMVGFQSSSSQHLYSNPLNILSFPFTYGDVAIDTMQYTINNPLPYYYRTCIITDSADAHGTMILPFGSIPNLLRIHRQFNWRDSSLTSGTVANLLVDHYYWYKAGVHYPVVSFIVKHFGFFDDHYLYYIAQNSLGENELSDQTKFLIYPTITSSEINITLLSGAKAQIKIVNSLGDLVCEKEIRALKSQLSVAHLLKGVYFIEAVAGKEVYRAKFVKE